MNGTETTSVRILGYPEFLAFAKQKGGVIATPIDMLNVPVSMTVRNAAIINYLQHLISGLTFSKNAEDNRKRLPTKDTITINYNTIYEIADLKPLIAVNSGAGQVEYSRTYTSRIRETVKKILNSWKERGYIKGWEEVKTTRNKVYGIRIDLIDNSGELELLT